jgi:hypothetical protein
MSGELFHITIGKLAEHEDGGGTYTFDMNHTATQAIQAMAQYGLDLVIRCAAYGVDIQDALDNIATLEKKEEDNSDGAPT